MKFFTVWRKMACCIWQMLFICFVPTMFSFRVRQTPFTEGWDNHPLQTEGGLFPSQLWVVGHMKNPCDPNKDLQNMELFGTDWEMFDAVHEEPYGVQVQEIECPSESVHSGNCTVHDKSLGIIRIITMVQCIEKQACVFVQSSTV